MILTLSKKIVATLLIGAFFGFLPLSTKAQSSLALSVSPTLFEISAVPGQVWKSSVKVINSNNYPITVYGNPVNFSPKGEGGQGNLIPILDVFDKASTLAGWIEMTEDTVEVPPEESKQVEFVVRVPEDAPPGGHFAAILVGTQPPDESEGVMQLRTSQIVSSLFFLRIEGDVVEDGAIRSFSSANNFTDVTSAEFELRFENKGNVHLRPQGSIEIYNMWGSERGVIPINQRTNFGNVLPESIRKFDFIWTGEQSFTDIGRFKAVASLAYGADQRKFTSQTTYFWIVPIKTLVATILFMLSVILFARWSIKVYVRKMLMVAGVSDGYVARRDRVVVDETDLDLSRVRNIRVPLTTGWNDFKNTVEVTKSILPLVTSLCKFTVQYRLFFGALVVFVGIIILVTLFFIDSSSDRDYDIMIINDGNTVSLNSEEVRLAELLRGQPESIQSSQPYIIEIYNSSNVTGAAADVALLLQQKEYVVEKVDFFDGDPYERTVIVFTTDLQDEALALSTLLDGALLSADQVTSSSSVIKIFVGNNYIRE